MSGLEHIVHACVIISIAWAIMRYGLNLAPSVAENRSLALGSFALSYMLIFGHGLPSFDRPRVGLGIAL